MRFPILLLLLALVGVAAPSAQTTYEVRQESAPGAGDFDTQPLLGTVGVYDGTGTTAEAYYNRASGAPYTYQGPRPLYSSFALDRSILFLVETQEGLVLMNVIKAAQTNTLWNTTTSGPFDALLVQDDENNADDTFSFAAGTLTAGGKIGATFGDGSGLLVRSGAPEPIYFEMNPGTNRGLDSTFAAIQVYGPDGAGGNTVVSAVLDEDRRVRLAPVALEVGGAAPANLPGWRLLSAPVAGLDVLDLAALNLVSGVQAGAVNASQYEGAGYINARGDLAGNLFHAYEGLESVRNAAGTADSAAVIYRPVPDADYTFLPGRGIWWYWYDQAIPDGTLAAAYGSGIGDSYNLLDPAFSLAASGPAASADVSVAFPLASVLPATFDGDGDSTPDASIPDEYFYMGGNPFSQPFNVDGISASGGTVQGLVYAWDPAANSGAGGHVPLVRSGALDGSGDAAAVWQGLMIEVTPDGAAGPTITYAAAMRDGAASPPFYGKTDGLTASGATPEVRFTLSGAGVEDRAWLRFLPDADGGFERHDGSKFAGAAAQIAFPIRQGDGFRRLAMNALPDGSSAPLDRTVNVPMAFKADAAGTYTLAWESALADGWRAYLVDRETGARVKMWQEASYTFAAASGDWAGRFMVTVRPASGAATVAPEAAAKADAETRVGEAYPNPAAAASRIEVVLASEADVRVSVVDALGREVAVAHDGPLAAGATAVSLPVDRLAAGTYVVRVSAPGVAETRRLTVTR